MDPASFCDESSHFKELVSPWDYSKKEGICIEIKCATDETRMERKRCFKEGNHPNTIALHIDDRTWGPDSNGYHGTFQEIVLVPGEKCFEECRPVERRTFGIKRKDQYGIDRESCRQCFAQRSELTREEIYYIPEVEKTLYKGMKCHHLCQFEKGEFSDKREFSVDCQKCVGMNGHEPETFQYLLNKKGTCYEVDSDDKRRSLAQRFCQGEDAPILTQYEDGSSFSFQVYFLGRDPKCYEVDEKTGGRIYKREVSGDHCQEEAVDDSERGSGKDERDDNGKDSAPSGAEAKSS